MKKSNTTVRKSHLTGNRKSKKTILRGYLSLMLNDSFLRGDCYYMIDEMFIIDNAQTKEMLCL